MSQATDFANAHSSALALREPRASHSLRPALNPSQLPPLSGTSKPPTPRLHRKHRHTTHNVPLTTPGIDPTQVVLTKQPLGHGSFGSVYCGTFSGSPVAIKVCAAPKPSDNTSALTSVHHFRRETARYHHLRHPCIVQFFCVVHHAPSNNLLLVTELMRGGSLFQALRILRRLGVLSLPLPTLLRLATHIANGLAYLHASSFSFGDLKSMNVLLSEPVDVTRKMIRPSTQAKLCDFGLSRNLKRLVPGHDPPGTSSKGPVGTYAYLAPESFTNQYTTDPDAAKAADVYALAIVLWELASLQPPWPNRQPLQLVRLVAKERRRPTWPNKMDLPSNYIKLVQRCWGHEPTQRPTAQIVARELAGMMNELGSTDLSRIVASGSPFRRPRYANIDKSLPKAGPVRQEVGKGKGNDSGTSVSSGSSRQSSEGSQLDDNRKERPGIIEDDVLGVLDDDVMFQRVTSERTDGEDTEVEGETSLGTPRFSDVTRTHATLSPPPSVDVGPLMVSADVMPCGEKTARGLLDADVMRVSERIDDVLIDEDIDLSELDESDERG